MSFLREREVQEDVLTQLANLGYELHRDDVIGPDGTAPERVAYDQVILEKRLREAVARLNPDVPASAHEDVVRRVLLSDFPSLLEENRRLHKAMIEGVHVTYRDPETGRDVHTQASIIDLVNPSNNDLLVTDEFTVVEGEMRRRADIVIFINGMPLAVIELKNPGSDLATIHAAINQLQTYKQQIPNLFRTNAALIVTDGLTARVGSLTANSERFMPWRTTDGQETLAKGHPETATLIEGVLAPHRLLELIRDFTVFMDHGTGLIKILAGYHQLHAVKRAVDQTVTATSPAGDRRVGVIWHTQGSGKSLLMAFYAGKLVRDANLENPTIVVITDRNDLDDQLYGTFAACADLIRQSPVQAESRADLHSALNRSSGGVVFTTIQKFAPATGEDAVPVLTDRRNVVVIADEAHRSQYGFKAHVEQRTGEVSFGFAKHLRDALPNASFIGFTGTPIEKDDVNTPAVFGEYIDVYDISRAVEDGATVPIYYESRLARIELPEEEKPRLDAEIADITGDEPDSEAERLKRKWSDVEALVGSEKRLRMVAKDLVEHFEHRVASMDGKAMVVCMSRRICVEMYDEITRLRPDWHSDDDQAGEIKVVMTGSASDPLEWQSHIGNKARRDAMARRLKDPNDPLKLVLVRDMWLTGFDAPSVHTMYIDKPMRGHGLMQAIARVNRVFQDKPAGLVVDYIGIAQNLRDALSQYSDNDKRQAGIDQADAVALMLEKYDVVTSMLHGHPYKDRLNGTSEERLQLMAETIDFVQRKQHEAAENEPTPDGKKRAHRRFQDNVLALSKAFALASSSDEAKAIREEVALFQAVRKALTKSNSPSNGNRSLEREYAVRQLIDEAIGSTDIVDILAASGVQTPNIGVLSDEFLAELQTMERKNLALEALKKLTRDEVRSRTTSNVVQGKAFSDRLEDAIAKYHTNAISTAEVIQELINLAKDMRAARNAEQESDLTPDEIAFYDALAQNESAMEVIGVDELKVIAQILLDNLKKNVTVDWAHRESARARLRILVKDILEDHGYPPDLSKEAVQTVLQQAEALSANWSTQPHPNTNMQA